MVFGWLSGSEDVADLIAKRSYGRAVKLLRTQIDKDPRNPLLRQQLADVLALDGKTREAVDVLLLVADEFAVGGFVAKAIAVLKKIQRLDPSRTGIDEKLARLVKEKDQETTHRIFLRREGAKKKDEEPTHARRLVATDFEPARAADAALDAAIAAAIAAAQESEAVQAAPQPEFEVTIPEEAPAAAPSAATLPPEEAAPAVTPLFGDFSQAELVEVMRGLELVSYDAGDIIVAEGEPGDSLFVLTTGTVKAFVKDPTGHYFKVREMYDGAFFGEVSILTGKPRSATITAASRCELLVLDRKALEDITQRQPNVRTILWDFCEARLGSKDEVAVRSGSLSGSFPSAT